MGFLQICSGVVLLQLSKSAKDVPDAAVFKGDLDQVRTVAEVEEPEYEPRADTLRGGAAILRSLSKARSKKELNEAIKIKEEHMEPIGEGEQVEFDGLRRRKTIVGDFNRPPTRSGTVMTKTVHPPLGMSQFPTYDSDDDNDSFHPGFFQRLRSRGKSTSSRGSSHAPGPNTMGMKNLPPIPTDGTSDMDRASDKDSYKQGMSEDTSYNPHDAHIQFASLPEPPTSHDRQASGSSSLKPAHMAKRQFSFQNVFGRHRAESTGESSGKRPVSRNSRKSSREGKVAGTEEERLGLVKGDSTHLLPIASHGSDELNSSSYSDWGLPRSSSPGFASERAPPPPIKGIRRTDTDEIDPLDDKDLEKSGPRSGAFL